MMRLTTQLLTYLRVLLVGCLLLFSPIATPDKTEENLPLKFASIILGTKEQNRESLRYLRKTWDKTYIAPLVEILILSDDPARRQKIVDLLEYKTRRSFSYDVEAWFKWLWSQDVGSFEQYPEFKSWLYGHIDPRFKGYFRSRYQATIRLDEVRWGGVTQDGIPPLRHPKMISADAAEYLKDDNTVFAIEINGDYRAYPKRILAWHEMFVDEVGGKTIAGVYCTLCGSMIIYETTVNGVNHELGTSGFLYRSNKLMYDRATQSLWSTLKGAPVMGPLVGQGIALKSGSIITTTWGEWRRRYPQTTVLSLDTGYERDYGEGVAYRKYFATDRLMFNVPKLDRRLKNKAEILGIRLQQYPDEPLAISVKFLSKHPVYHQQIGNVRFVILTDSSGASRVYHSGRVQFVTWDGDQLLNDVDNLTWTLAESELRATNGETLTRMPAHRAFWFGWYSAYTNTRLIR